jgi:Putative transposase
LDGSRWIACRPGFFLPVAVMRRLFRGKFLALFHEAYRNDRLSFHGQQQPLADPALFVQFLDSLRQTEWVVYAKPPYGGPESVLKYLARYTHRVAISNHRLIKMEEGKVFFHWKDYAHGSVQKTMALDAVEFLRRFLQHVVPSGFVRIRHFGFLSPRCKEEKLQRCRQLLAEANAPASEILAAPPVPVAGHPKPAAEPAADRHRCPHCGRGHMFIVERFEAGSPPPRPTVAPSVRENTS